MPELFLNSYWKSKGAVFIEERAWKIPAHFGNAENEYAATRAQNAVSDYSYCGIIRVSGSDRISFLHNILTNDIKKLKPTESCDAALLAHTGKVLMFMKVRVLKNEVLLLVEMNFADKALELLNKYLIAEDVQIENVSDESVLLCPLGIIKKELAEQTVIQFFEKNPKMIPIGYQVSEIIRIEDGILRHGIDFDENVSLPETGLDEKAASETKGCYPGQEVVARIKTYQGLQRRAVQLKCEGTKVVQVGDKIYVGAKEIGWITSTCYSPKFKQPIALGYVSKGFFEKSTSVDIRSGQEKIQAITVVIANEAKQSPL